MRRQARIDQLLDRDNSFAFVISLKQQTSSDNQCYLFDFVYKNVYGFPISIWTKSLKAADKFFSEQSVEEFRALYFKNKPVEILKLNNYQM